MDTAKEGSNEWSGGGWKSDISNRCTTIFRVYGVNVNTDKALGVTTES
jgi:hypothetical protein